MCFQLDSGESFESHYNATLREFGDLKHKKLARSFKGNLLLLTKYELRSLQFLQDLVHGRPSLRITVVSVRCI